MYNEAYPFKHLLYTLSLGFQHSKNATMIHKIPNNVLICLLFVTYNCDWIYGNRSKSHIGSYKIIDFKDFKTL